MKHSKDVMETYLDLAAAYHEWRTLPPETVVIMKPEMINGQLAFSYDEVKPEGAVFIITGLFRLAAGSQIRQTIRNRTGSMITAIAIVPHDMDQYPTNDTCDWMCGNIKSGALARITQAIKLPAALIFSRQAI